MHTLGTLSRIETSHATSLAPAATALSSSSADSTVTIASIPNTVNTHARVGVLGGGDDTKGNESTCPSITRASELLAMQVKAPR